MTATLLAPPLVSSRRQAQELLFGVPEDLRGAVIELVCSDLQSAAPSFLDELVRTVLVERHADRLVLTGARERTRTLATRAAVAHAVAERLSV